MSVDLRTGEYYDARKEDYATKSAAIPPETIDTPLWRSFLDKITGGDVALQNYLQRMAGYCLTGLTTEHVLFFLYGTGANGKSVFINTLMGILKDYAAAAPMSTFMASPTDQHPTDLAMLHGVRLVVAQETEVGRHWAEARIKAITGGDPVTARFMRADFFTYTPQFKLVIVGNHKPVLHNLDEAIRRCIHLVPFTVTIPPEERDKGLFDKLKPEWPGILQWAIDGCMEWRRIGLAPPAAVVNATDKYLADEDSFAHWLEEKCITGKGLQRAGGDLWGSYKAWCDLNNEHAGAQKTFGQELEKRGFERRHTMYGALYRGIDLKPPPAREYDPGN